MWYLFAHVFSRCPNMFWKIANHCNILICTINQTIVPWTVINVEPSINFEELLVQIKPGVFSTISALLELSSSILDSVYIRQDKSTDNSTVYSMTINSESTWPGLSYIAISQSTNYKANCMQQSNYTGKKHVQLMLR